MHPDPSQESVVEIDASDSGVGTVISKGNPDTLNHTCAFLSRCLSPAQCTYDMGNRKLLVMVLALQEWRQWLEGAKVLDNKILHVLS